MMWSKFRADLSDFFGRWVLTAASLCTRAIDCFSEAGYWSLVALMSTAYTRSGQSERNVQPAPIRALERLSCLGGRRRILSTHWRVTLKSAHLTQHRAQGCHYRIYAFPPPSFNCLWPTCLSLQTQSLCLWFAWIELFPIITSKDACQLTFASLSWIFIGVRLAVGFLLVWYEEI